jgi:hypothetical protein
MFERFFEQDTKGELKGLTLEWTCTKCDGLNFKLILKEDRNRGDCHARCRYCRAKYRVQYPVPAKPVEGEDEFLERMSREDFTRDEELDMIKDFAEIAALKVDKGPPGVILVKQKALEEKFAFTKRRRR